MWVFFKKEITYWNCVSCFRLLPFNESEPTCPIQLYKTKHIITNANIALHQDADRILEQE